MEYAYVNGSIVPKNEATISIFDIGLLRGLGIYEAMGVWNGDIFHFAEHMARFRRSAQGIKIDVPKSDEEIRDIIFKLAEKNFAKDASGKLPRLNVKFILTGGRATGSLQYDPTHPTFCIFTEPWHMPAPDLYERGAKLITCEHMRHYAEYKTTDYITAVRLQNELRVAGAIEGLYTHLGTVLECTTSNFFIIEGAMVATAKDDVLPGITRMAVIEALHQAGMVVEERTIGVKEALAADECFITSSFKDVMPVTVIDDTPIGDGTVGEHTRKIMALYKDFAGLR